MKLITKFKEYFHIASPYEFDITDITALIYVICVIGVLCGADMTVLFFIGSAIATAFCLKGRRLNLVVLNVALFVMNAYYLVCKFGG